MKASAMALASAIAIAACSAPAQPDPDAPSPQSAPSPARCPPSPCEATPHACPPCEATRPGQLPSQIAGPLPGGPGFWCFEHRTGTGPVPPGEYFSECFREEYTCTKQVEYYRKKRMGQMTDCSHRGDPGYCFSVDDPLRMRRLFRCSDSELRCRVQLDRYRTDVPDYRYGECQRNAARTRPGRTLMSGTP